MSTSQRKGLTGRRRYAVGAGLCLFLLAADQLSKWAVLRDLWPREVREVIPHFLNLTLSRNTGGSFGMLTGRALLFTILSAAALILLGYLFTRLRGNTGASLAVSGVMAGAAGNLIDRLRFGFVIDFIDFHWYEWHWYVFNVADAAITVGAIGLLIATFVDERRRDRAERRARVDSAEVIPGNR